MGIGARRPSVRCRQPDRAAWPEHSVEFAQGAGLIRDDLEQRFSQHGVELGISQRQVVHSGTTGADGHPRRCRTRPCKRKPAKTDVERRDVSSAARQLNRQRSRSAAGVEHRSARRDVVIQLLDGLVEEGAGSPRGSEGRSDDRSRLGRRDQRIALVVRGKKLGKIERSRTSPQRVSGAPILFDRQVRIGVDPPIDHASDFGPLDAAPPAMDRPVIAQRRRAARAPQRDVHVPRDDWPSHTARVSWRRSAAARFTGAIRPIAVEGNDRTGWLREATARRHS